MQFSPEYQYYDYQTMSEMNFYDDNSSKYIGDVVNQDQFLAGSSPDSMEPQNWTVAGVQQWLTGLASMPQNSFYQIFPERYAGVDGIMLTQMSLENFLERDPHSGKFLYDELQKLLPFASEPSPMLSYTYLDDVEEPMAKQERVDSTAQLKKLMDWYLLDGSDKLPSMRSFMFPQETSETAAVKAEVQAEVIPPPSPSPSVSTTSDSGISNCEELPPKKSSSKRRRKGKLWEFVRDLLLDAEHNPKIIKWEDHSNGVFRIVRSDKVAELWGKRKCNPTMTYEKMSRALRHYYKRNILESINGRRLVYKFGTNSRGWQLQA